MGNRSAERAGFGNALWPGQSTSLAFSERIHQAMRHVEAVLKLLDPSYSLRGISVRRRKPNPYFKRGTVFRAALDALRRAGKPMTAAEITLAMLAAKGFQNVPEKAMRDLDRECPNWVKRCVSIEPLQLCLSDVAPIADKRWRDRFVPEVPRTDKRIARKKTANVAVSPISELRLIRRREQQPSVSYASRANLNRRGRRRTAAAPPAAALLAASRSSTGKTCRACRQNC